mmetsp:Transcript_5286/g.7695  ORF Transcript_5286/g.7695 Transcript_5286/m.7695 type:complete len:319 (-) Transcript_5286:14-970(-)
MYRRFCGDEARKRCFCSLASKWHRNDTLRHERLASTLHCSLFIRLRLDCSLQILNHRFKISKSLAMLTLALPGAREPLFELLHLTLDLIVFSANALVQYFNCLLQILHPGFNIFELLVRPTCGDAPEISEAEILIPSLLQLLQLGNCVRQSLHPGFNTFELLVRPACGDGPEVGGAEILTPGLLQLLHLARNPEHHIEDLIAGLFQILRVALNALCQHVQHLRDISCRRDCPTTKPISGHGCTTDTLALTGNVASAKCSGLIAEVQNLASFLDTPTVCAAVRPILHPLWSAIVAMTDGPRRQKIINRHCKRRTRENPT